MDLSKNLDTLKVKFTHSGTTRVKDKRPYTIYEIEVRSSSTITWVIYKRYSEFDHLHTDLTKAKDSYDKPVTLPSLPPKRLTRSLAPEFVEKRKQELQEYLRAVLNNSILRRNEIVLSFLEVPDSVRPMLADGGGHDDDYKQDDTHGSQYSHYSPEEKTVLELVNQLKFKKSKVSSIKQFEEYLFENRPRFSAEYIRLLFQGERGNGGLIQTCGDFAYSRVASRAALELLCRLLDVEKNKDSQLFLDTFCSLDSSILQELKLHQHILGERGDRLGAFRLLDSLKDKMPMSQIERLVSDTYARQAYLKWAERKTQSLSTSANEPQETVLKAVDLDEVGSKKIAEKAFHEVMNIAHSESQWQVVKTIAPEYSHIRLTYKTDARRDLVTVRLTAQLTHNVDEVTKLLIDLRRRKEWDLKFHRGQRLEKLDSTTDVVHEVFKSFSSPYKYRDFVLLRSWTKLKGGGRLIAVRSVIYNKLPEMKDHVRAIAYSSGYAINPTNDNTGCILTFVAQLDRESVLIVSPDLLGESDQLCQSVLLLQDALSQSSRPSTANSSISNNSNQ